MITDNFPNVTGHVTLELKKDGKVVETVKGKNIWTNTGRQFLADLIRYDVYVDPTNPGTSTPKRVDRVAYFGLGSGSQIASVDITSLVSPVSFDAYPPAGGGDRFLAYIQSSSQSNEPDYTGVTFEREFSVNELVDSSGNPIILTEIGLYTDGDQLNDFAVGIESINGINSNTPGFAPIAYKTFEPITKTTDYVLRITWQVRFS